MIDWILFVPYLISFFVVSITANVNSIPMLNDTNLKTWKNSVWLVLGVMDLDWVLWVDPHAPLTPNNTFEEKKSLKDGIDRTV